MKTRISLEVNTKVYNKVLWLISQFKSNDVRIVDESVDQDTVADLEKHKELDRILENIEVSYESVSLEEVY